MKTGSFVCVPVQLNGNTNIRENNRGSAINERLNYDVQDTNINQH